MPTFLRARMRLTIERYVHVAWLTNENLRSFNNFFPAGAAASAPRYIWNQDGGPYVLKHSILTIIRKNSLEINQCLQRYCLICVLTALHWVLENEIQWNQVNIDCSQSPIFSVRSSRSSALRYGFLLLEFSESSPGVSMKSCMKSRWPPVPV